MPIRKLFDAQGFDTIQTERLGAAFDTAWQVLKKSRPDFANGPLTTSARETLAKMIIEEAKLGEMSSIHLVDRAVIRFLDHR